MKTFATEASWLDAGAKLGATHTSNQFEIGDWYNSVPRAKIDGKIAVDDAPRKASVVTGLGVSTIQRYADVAGKIDTNSRIESLSFEVHYVVRNETPAKQATLLKRAEKEQWVTSKAREVVTGKTAAQHKADTAREQARKRRVAGIPDPTIPDGGVHKDYQDLARRTRENKAIEKTVAIQKQGPVVNQALKAARSFEALLLELHEPARLQQFSPEGGEFFSRQLANIIKLAVSLQEELS